MSKYMAKKANKGNSLEIDYKKYFQPIVTKHPNGWKRSYAQPHILKSVDSVVTYGAYEEPI